VFFLSIVITVRVSAQHDAIPLIHEVVATYKGAKSYHFESFTESELVSELHRSWSKSREILVNDQPDRVHFETIENNGSYGVVSDGKSLWRAAPDTREFIRTAVTAPILDTRRWAGSGSRPATAEVHDELHRAIRTESH
jgi:outer membrane lipoprotein-sorting protein